MRCAIYARVSTDIQSQNSTDDQRRECQAYADRAGYKIHQIYVDEAVSGSDVSRSAYNHLKTDAFAGKFDCILVDDLSRIGRDMPEFINLYRDLNEFGVTIIGIADGIDTSKASSKIPLYMKGMMNEIFLDDLKAKIVRGLKGQVLRGYSTGGRVFGYRTEPIYDPTGAVDKFGRPKRYGCKILIDQQQSEIVGRIFSMKASGLGLRSIAHILNSEGIPSPHAGCGSRKGFWSTSTLLNILSNKKYIGVWEYNKTRWIKKPVRGKRKSLPNSPDDWVVFRSEDLRIVSDDIFNLVNSDGHRRYRVSASGRKSYLLSGLLACGECGGSMIVTNSGRSSTFICGNARSQGPASCSNRHRVSRFEVEAAFISEMRNALFNPDMINLIASLMRKKLKDFSCTQLAGLDQLRKHKLQLEKNLQNLLDGLEIEGPSVSIKTRIQQREFELNQVYHELKRASQSNSDLTEITIDSVKESLINLRVLLSEYQNKLPIIRNELRGLFPEKLKIKSHQVKEGREFTICGKANPFNLPNVKSNLQLSIIAVQGLEAKPQIEIPVIFTVLTSAKRQKRTG